MVLSSTRVCAAFALACSTVLGCATAPAPAPEPLPAPVAEAAPAPEPVFESGPALEVRSERAQYRIEADGAVSFVYTLVFRVLRVPEDAPWQELTASWSPERQERPAMSMRVEHPDGTIVELDPSLIEEVELETPDELGYRRRQLSAAVPGLVPGAVVTQRVEKKDRKGIFGVGAAGRFYLGMRVEVPESRLEFELPVDLPIAIEPRGLEVEPEVSESEGRRRIVYVVKDVQPSRPEDLLLTPDHPPVPYVAFSTAPSWTAFVEPLAAELGASVGGAMEVAKSLGRRLRGKKLVEAAIRTVRAEASPDVGLGPLERSVGSAQTTDGVALASRLAAILRERGLEAVVALVRSGPDEDIRPDLPELQGFDRALVRVSGRGLKDTLWVEPSEPHVGLLELSPQAKGRWALLVAPEASQALVRTPEAKAEDTTYLERRSLVFSGFGRGKVVETTEATGMVAARLRNQLGTPSERRGLLEGYVGSQYGARLGDIEVELAPDAPVRVELTGRDAGSVRTDIFRGATDLPIAPLFAWLPPLLRDAALAPDEAENDQQRRQRAAAALVQRRTLPAHLPRPYQARLLYEVQVPIGFEVETMPEDRQLELGLARYSAKWSKTADKLIGELAFDTGPAAQSADELRALVVGLRRLWSESSAQLEVRHIGAAKLEEEAYGEALRAFAKDIDAHPSSAEARARLALGLLDVGLGDAARATATEAVKLDEDSVLARLVQAQVLSHDLVGRRYGAGFDRRGAIEALRTVKVLDPSQVRARIELANLRAMSDEGVENADRAGIEAAVAEFRILREQVGRGPFDEALLEALFHAGRYEDLLLEAEDMKRSLRRDGLALAARLRLDGSADGAGQLLEALELPPPMEPMVRAVAGAELAKTRAYGLARAVLEPISEKAATTGPIGKGLERIRKLERVDALMVAQSEPLRPVQEVLRRAVLEPELAGLEEAFSSVLSAERRVEEAARLARTLLAVRMAAQRARMAPELYLDSLFSNAEFEAEVKGNGARVSAELDGFRPLVFYVRAEPGGYKLVGRPFGSGALGIAALDSLQSEGTAGPWLAWADDAWKDPDGTPAEDRFEGVPYVLLRQRFPAAETEAALALAAMGPVGGPQRDALAARVKDAEPELADQLRHARAIAALFDGAAEASLEDWRQLSRAHPESDAVRAGLVDALLAAKRFPEALKVAKVRVDKQPESRSARMQLANVELARGRFDVASRALEKLVDEEASSTTMNNLAWTSLFRDKVSERDVELARAANALTKNRSATELHTLASVLAERGRIAEATKALRKRFEVLGASEPESVDYWIIGRVLEHVGLNALSRASYERVAPDESGRADDTHALAVRQLRRLRRQR